MARIVQPTPDSIAEAAKILRGGGLVAFPTETVYGLGANALDADAVARIFIAKGRPSTNPIIVHVASVAEAEMIGEFSLVHPEEYYNVLWRLTDQLWPGPITIVVRKKPTVPDIVTAGGPTVGIRMPNHPVALALLRACGFPLAAPSANRSEQISPTTAEHVAASLGDAVEMILDGGPCAVGLESTVLDCTKVPLRILRPGMVSSQQIWDVSWLQIAGSQNTGGPSRSPGQMRRHYAPKTRLVLDACDDFWFTAAEAPPYIPLLTYSSPRFDVDNRVWIRLPDDPDGYAAGLYAALHRLDEAAVHSGAAYILVQHPPDSRAWDAIRDRLTRASAA